MSSKPTLRRHFKAQRHLGEAATRSIQNAVAAADSSTGAGVRTRFSPMAAAFPLLPQEML